MVKVVVEKKTYTVDSPYQWDVEQVLEVHGLSLSTTPEVHFAHDNMRYAIVRQATMDAAGVIRAGVPNSLLQKASRINAYICVREGDTFQSLHKIVIPVNARSKPGDYEYKDEYETYSLETVIVEAVTLATGAEATVEKVINADGTITFRFGLPGGVPGPKGDTGPKGETGAPFTYDMFTAEQLRALTGPAGKDGIDGEDGDYIVSITRTSGNGAAGTTDTYTIKMSDNKTYTFQVYNGRDGEGSGDMSKDVYDTENKNTDIFKYVDNKIADIDVEVTADEVTFADGETFQQKFNSGELTGPAGKDGGTGPAGKDGADGENGVGIQNVEQTTTSTADGGENIITVTKTDGSKSTFSVRNGGKGSTGESGAAGKNATINGVNALTLEAGENVTLSQSGSTATISASGGGKQYTVTLPSSAWSSNNGYFVMEGIAIVGLKATYKVAPSIDVELTGTDASADKELIEAFGSIVQAITYNNTLTVRGIGTAPTINIPIVINVWE